MPPTTANQDPAELNKFDESSSQWWDFNGPLKTLHHINPTRLDFILKQVGLANKTVCDVGCGGGILTESLADHAASVCAIDLNPSAIATAIQHAADRHLQNVHYEVCATEDYADQHPCEFDAVCCMEMLEHVPEPAAIVQACYALLKPGGMAFFATINRSLPAYLKTVIAAEYLLGLLPRGTHDYARFIKPAELSAFCRQAGFELASIKGMAYLPYAERAWLTDKPESNYLLSVRKPQTN